MIDEEIQKYKQLFGDDSLQPGVKPGDKTPIRGVFASVTERLFKSMFQGLQPEERQELEKSWEEAKKNGMFPDDEISKVLEDLNGMQDE